MKHIKALFFDVDNTLYTHRIHDFPATTRSDAEPPEGKRIPYRYRYKPVSL